MAAFEAGIQRALERLLVDPEFLFRVEHDPAGAAPPSAYRVSDLELASRLSFFLWSSIPDDELLDAGGPQAAQPAGVLQQQTRRLFDDPRARRALVENFAGQWLELRNIREHTPDPDIFDEFDENLRDAMRRETELFIDSQLSADRSVVELLNADYTFVNERLARHYGIPGVYGERFRRVSLGAGPGPPQRTARPGEPVDGDLVPEPDVAGAARQMGARQPARRPAAAAAARRQHDADGQGRERAVRLGARTARGAPPQPGVLELPRADGSAGVRAGEFRSDGPVAGDRRRRQRHRRVGRARRRQPFRGSCRPAVDPAGPPRSSSLRP